MRVTALVFSRFRRAARPILRRGFRGGRMFTSLVVDVVHKRIPAVQRRWASSPTGTPKARRTRPRHSLGPLVRGPGILAQHEEHQDIEQTQEVDVDRADTVVFVGSLKDGLRLRRKERAEDGAAIFLGSLDMGDPPTPIHMWFGHNFEYLLWCICNGDVCAEWHWHLPNCGDIAHGA